MRHTVETKFDSVVNETVATHALPHAGLLEEIGDAVFDDARANAVLYVIEASSLDDDGVDALALEEMSEQETGRTGADDNHLRAN
jgi:hypothetical protein